MSLTPGTQNQASWSLLAGVHPRFKGAALELQSDRALLLPIGGDRTDRIQHLAIAEGHVHAEAAVGVQGNRLIPDAGDQRGITPERAR